MSARRAAKAAEIKEARPRPSLWTALLNAPYILWSVLFIIIPLVLVAFYAFTETVNYYDIRFDAGGEHYEYEIASMDGDTTITLDEAKEKALSMAGVDAEAAEFTVATLKNRMGSFTLDNFKDVFSAGSLTAMRLSLVYSLAATVISLIIAYPFAYI